MPSSEQLGKLRPGPQGADGGLQEDAGGARGGLGAGGRPAARLGRPLGARARPAEDFPGATKPASRARLQRGPRAAPAAKLRPSAPERDPRPLAAPSALWFFPEGRFLQQLKM